MNTSIKIMLTVVIGFTLLSGNAALCQNSTEENEPVKEAISIPSEPSLRVELNDRGFQSMPWHESVAGALNRKTTRIFKAVMKLPPYSIHHPQIGYRWKTSDSVTLDWRPQGITGLKHGERRFLSVSWYHRDDSDRKKNVKGVRISFLEISDLNNVKYRHALLVEPSQDAAKYPVFQPVKSHAGGLAVFRNHLYVADSQNGIRQFDLNHVLSASKDETKSRCGLFDGELKAFDYRFIIPQVGQYQLVNSPVSFLSFDRQNSELLTGNYHDPEHGYDTAPIQLAWWKIDQAGKIRHRVRHLDSGLPQRIQGAVELKSDKGVFAFLSTSYGAQRGKLYVRDLKDNRPLLTHSWPQGAEDLYYDSESRRLWCLTEFSPHRLFFSVDPADYLPEKE